MKYGIFGDIHGNLEALETVLDALERGKVDHLIAVGDFVGYGANPRECVKRVRAIKGLIAVAGNHDWAVVEKTPLFVFNSLALEAVLWTREQLDRPSMNFLKNLPLVVQDKHYTVVHSSLDRPESFEYIQSLDQAGESLALQSTPVCFVGHTHVPGFFFNGKGENYAANGVSCRVKPEGQAMINVGSVGQPRDEDVRAAYSTYDTTTGKIKIHRIAYDVERASGKILSAGLPPMLAERLHYGR